MWLRVASKCASTTQVETWAGESSIETIHWVRDRLDSFCSRGAHGPLYIFVQPPPAPDTLADVVRCVAEDRRLEAIVVAEGMALTTRAHLELLEQAGMRALYTTLHGASASVHDARIGASGSWRRALALLTVAPRILKHVRVGVHFGLSPESAGELAKVLQLIRGLGNPELLLWDAGCGGMDVRGMDPSMALRALDFALTSAQKLRLRICPVGFERISRTVVAAGNEDSCTASAAIVELLRVGIPLPSAASGVRALDGDSVALAELTPTGRATAQLALELAASGHPLLDLPVCLGGPPPEHQLPWPDSIKVEACRQCPIDSRCSGVPRPMVDIPGLRHEIGPPVHWRPVPKRARVLVLCPIVTDTAYGATFFSLARELTRLGAQVDVVSPWAIHANITSSFPETQPIDQPEGANAVERFVHDGPVERYDLIITPDLHTARTLIVNGRLQNGARLAATDFHMLWGMDDWVRDLCPRGQRAEEGGWWPSDQVILYSTFPGYARLYARYGIPLRQIVWQPYALDPGSFPVAGPASSGVSIVSSGRHQRDFDTLLSAAARLRSSVHPIDLFAEDETPHASPNIRFHGTIISSAAVRRSRFVVVPLLDSPYNAAGITTVATAIICGRPVVVTATAASRDYVVDGVNGLLVPPGDVRALAEAIERLDTDPALLTALAAGARGMAQQLTTEAWAHTLLFGSRTYDREHWMWAKWPPRHPATPAVR